jgi:hypothetical protein
MRATSDRSQRAYRALTPAEAEIAAAGTGLFTLGPVSRYLRELAEPSILWPACLG